MAFRALDTAETILAAAARHGLSVTPISTDPMGLDYLVVHAVDAQGARWILRAPRRPDVVASARPEAAVLAALRGFRVAVPDWVIADDIIAYRRLDGTPAVTLETGAPVWNIIDPAALSATFVASLREVVHALGAVAPGLPRKTMAEERELARRAIVAGREHLTPATTVVDRWQRFVDDDANWPEGVALVHADMHPGHLLLDERGAIIGILDWTEAHVGDPAIDYAMIFKCFGREVLDATAVGAPWANLVTRAIERTYAFPAFGAEWAARAGNAEIMAYVRSELPEA